MGANASADQVDDVVARLEEAGCGAVVTPGREATVIGAIGERELLAALPLEGYAGVEQVLAILKPYKPVSRERPPDPTVIEARGRRGRRDHAPRRRLQAAHLSVRLPGARRRGTRDPEGGPRRDRAADRHRADGPAPRRAGRRDDRRDPDRRPQHGELLASRRG